MQNLHVREQAMENERRKRVRKIVEADEQRVLESSREHDDHTNMAYRDSSRAEARLFRVELRYRDARRLDIQPPFGRPSF